MSRKGERGSNVQCQTESERYAKDIIIHCSLMLGDTKIKNISTERLEQGRSPLSTFRHFSIPHVSISQNEVFMLRS